MAPYRRVGSLARILRNDTRLHLPGGARHEAIDRAVGVLLTVVGVWLLRAVRHGVRDRIGADLPPGTILVVAVLLGGGVALFGALSASTSAEFQSFEAQLEEDGFGLERAADEDDRWVVAFVADDRGPGGTERGVTEIAERYAGAVPRGTRDRATGNPK